MSERDDELLRRYRALEREAPPPALDASILAASRRAARARAFPRWAAPVSAAAVLVLALGVVLKVQRESPEAVVPAESHEAAPAPSQPAAPALVAPESAAPPAATRQEPAIAPRAATEPPKTLKPEAKRAAPAHTQAAPAASTAPEPAAPRAEGSSALDAATGANTVRAPLAAQRSVSPDPLLRELERIAHLRQEAKDDEADAALAAFRREHPDYRIEPALWDRVRRH
jgi:hypothetical protein